MDGAISKKPTKGCFTCLECMNFLPGEIKLPLRQTALMDLLKRNVAKNLPLSADELEHFCHSFKVKEVKKKELLLKEGEVCRFEGFVTRGCFRIYHTDEKGDDHVLYFAVEDWWIGDIDSFMNQVPARLCIEALEDSEILVISKQDKDALYESLPVIEKLFRIMGQKRCIALQRRMIDNISKTAEQRYVEFITSYPQIARRVTNIQIAAYLGISHEFLSKIRKKLSPKS